MAGQAQISISIFSTDPVWSSIGKLAVPSMVTMIVMMLYNMADMFFVGLTGDVAQVAAVSMVTPAFSLIMTFSTLVSGGGCTLIARSYGEHKPEQVKVYSSLCFIASVGLGFLLILVVFLLKDQVIALLGANAEVWDHVDAYLSILVLGSPIMMFSATFSSIMGSDGQAKQSMLSNMISTVANIILDPLFILLWDMGVSGAALATVLANCIGALYVIWRIRRSSSALSFSPRHALQNPRALVHIVAYGLPNAINTLMSTVASTVGNRLLIGYGTHAVAAMGAAGKSVRIISYSQLGLCAGVQPMQAYLYGARNAKRLRELLGKMIVLTVIIGSALSLFCLFNSRAVIGIFLKDRQALELGMQMMEIKILAGPLLGLFSLSTGFLQSSGNAAMASFLSLLRQGILFVVLAYILNSLCGVMGNTWAHLLADVLATLVAVAVAVGHYRKTMQRWKEELA